MRENKTLMQLWQFWFALVLPILLGLGLGIWIDYYNNLTFDLTKHGLNTFLDYFKLPLSLASLSIPATALVAAIHRSEQTLVTIQESKRQNTFSNALKHREEFIKLLKEMETELDITFFDKYKFYKTLFKNNTNNNFDKTTDIDWFNYQVKQLTELTKRASKELDDRQIEGVFVDSFKLSDELSFRVNMGYIINSPDTFFSNIKNRAWAIAYEELKPFKHLQLAYSVINQLIYFCEYDLDTDLPFPTNDYIATCLMAKERVTHYGRLN
ncbi:hypothetical protein ACO1PK_02440 [Alishewanella sp. d11]|uniref:hypothetical protein n=1 Tax=Alishewanella sp. d11 TaxID=3414030 RepID=UPI003BF80DF8